MALKILILLPLILGLSTYVSCHHIVARMTLEECLNLTKKEHSLDPVPITAYLYNKHHYDYFLTNETWELAIIPHCDDIRIIVHGYHQSRYEMMPLIEAFFALEDTSVIAVDWSALSKAEYKKALASLDNLATSINYIIDRAIEKASQGAADVHLIGFGLGAQAAGRAGRLREDLIGWIVGLDPTVSGFDEDSDADLEMMLNRHDATHVRVIHTDGDHYGVRRPIGHADFYVNGGRYQPSCNETGVDVPTELCNHMRVIDYMVEAISWPRIYIGVRCASWYDMLYNYECRIVPDTQVMYVSNGDYNCPTEYTEGIYYVASNIRKPYYLNPPHYIFVAKDVIHISHTYGPYGSDYIPLAQCTRAKPNEDKKEDEGGHQPAHQQGGGGAGGEEGGEQQPDEGQEGENDIEDNPEARRRKYKRHYR